MSEVAVIADAARPGASISSRVGAHSTSQMLKKLKYCLSHTALYTADMLREHSRFDLLAALCWLQLQCIPTWWPWALDSTHDGHYTHDWNHCTSWLFSRVCLQHILCHGLLLQHALPLASVSCVCGLDVFKEFLHSRLRRRRQLLLKRQWIFFLCPASFIRCIWAILERIRRFVTYTTDVELPWKA